jgi:O-antigen ligase
VNFGIVGFIVVMALFVKIFVTEWRVYQRVKENWLAGSFSLGALALFVGFQTNGLVEWSFGDQEVVLVFWTSLGLTLALRTIAEKRSV